jgi:hypothetical protein
MTMGQARATGRPLLIGERPITRVSRAIEKGETKGFMQVAVDADTHRILGAAILGTGGDEAIHGVLDMMNAGVPTRRSDMGCQSIRRSRSSFRRCGRDAGDLTSALDNPLGVAEAVVRQLVTSSE